MDISVDRGAGVPTDTSRAPAVLETGARGGSSETTFFMHYLGPLQKFGRGRRDMYDDDLRAGQNHPIIDTRQRLRSPTTWLQYVVS